LASSLRASFPNPSVALLNGNFYWWESGTTLDALLTYWHVNADTSYNDLVSNTLLSQTTGTNDFMVGGQATGNDDQSWWALAAMTATEYSLPAPATPWQTLAANVFNDQKGRWQTDTCSGGLKWKINAGDTGYTYRSTISNALFFQLAARLARFNDDADALAWAEKAYSWMSTTGGGGGVVTSSFDVFDGTSDSNGCSDVNHDLWSYNTGAMLYGSAIMASHTNDQVWKDRAQGFLDAVKRNFMQDGRLFETKCEGAGSCNADQVSFKGILARWLGASAVVLPDLAAQVGEIL
ncbi:glycoside hydrolase family 76 protein, partial [Lophiostoma macrostomum CBS 122681]